MGFAYVPRFAKGIVCFVKSSVQDYGYLNLAYESEGRSSAPVAAAALQTHGVASSAPALSVPAARLSFAAHVIAFAAPS